MVKLKEIKYCGKIAGEVTSVSASNGRNFKLVQMQLMRLEGFNAEEVALLYKIMPDKMLKFKGEKYTNWKLLKMRLF